LGRTKVDFAEVLNHAVVGRVVRLGLVAAAIASVALAAHGNDRLRLSWGSHGDVFFVARGVRRHLHDGVHLLNSL